MKVWCQYHCLAKFTFLDLSGTHIYSKKYYISSFRPSEKFVQILPEYKDDTLWLLCHKETWPPFSKSASILTKQWCLCYPSNILCTKITATISTSTNILPSNVFCLSKICSINLCFSSSSSALGSKSTIMYKFWHKKTRNSYQYKHNRQWITKLCKIYVSVHLVFFKLPYSFKL